MKAPRPKRAGWMRRGMAAWLTAMPALAAGSAQPLSLFGISTGKNGSTLSVPIQVVILLTLMTVLPAAVMAMTPFLRITVVLHFLRQALGTQTTPSNQVLLGLALFLAIVIMQPVAADMYHQGWEPMEAGTLTPAQAMDAAAGPLRKFMVRFAREKDIRLFVEMAHQPAPHRPEDLDMKVLIPAYILSELKTGFQIGAVLYSAVPGNRPGGGFGDAFDRHGAVAAGDDLGALQDSAVRAGGRLESGGRLADEELLPMTPEGVVELIRQALMTAFWLSAPLLAIGFVAGIAVSLVQIATSMQDNAFSTIPRLVVFLVALLLLMPWMLHKMMAYTTALLGNLGRYAR